MGNKAKMAGRSIEVDKTNEPKTRSFRLTDATTALLDAIAESFAPRLSRAGALRAITLRYAASMICAAVRDGDLDASALTVKCNNADQQYSEIIAELNTSQTLSGVAERHRLREPTVA